MSDGKKTVNIAIDGPSGSGKSTLAKKLSAKYGFVYIDTGALYRTVGYAALIKNILPDDEQSIAKMLPEITLEMKLENGGNAVYLDGEKMGDNIRTATASAYASAVSALPVVRKFLLDTQRKIAETENVVMDGRDIGTVILPNADLKFFLSANENERAKRRFLELSEKGQKITLDEVKSQMNVRDKNDSTRKEAPAIPAADAIHIDNSGLTIEETVQKVSEYIEKKFPSLK